MRKGDFIWDFRTGIWKEAADVKNQCGSVYSAVDYNCLVP
jgi:hypothetical protein